MKPPYTSHCMEDWKATNLTDYVPDEPGFDYSIGVSYCVWIIRIKKKNVIFRYRCATEFVFRQLLSMLVAAITHCIWTLIR